MAEDKKPYKLEIMPGAFDSFEGTQEELDDLVKSFQGMIDDGSFMEESVEIDMDALAEDDPELYEILMARLAEVENPRKLN